MDEEDWDAPSESTPKVSSTNEETPQKTLKISEGYKYSYEANTSPANVDDWTEEHSYGSSNGFATPKSYGNRERGSKR